MSATRLPTSAITNAFSIDVEDWFQVSDFEDQVRPEDWDGYESRVVSNTRRLLRLLDEFRVKATFFVLTWNAEKHPALVEEIAAGGHEVATHGHAHRLVYELGPDLFRRDLDRSISILIGDSTLPTFAVPNAMLTATGLREGDDYPIGQGDRKSTRLNSSH